jgi:hypothetical protein
LQVCVLDLQVLLIRHESKNEPISQEMHWKILRLMIGLKMSSVEKLLFTYLRDRYHSWHQVDLDRCNFHIFMPALTIVSLLER